MFFEYIFVVSLKFCQSRFWVRQYCARINCYDFCCSCMMYNLHDCIVIQVGTWNTTKISINYKGSHHVVFKIQNNNIILIDCIRAWNTYTHISYTHTFILRRKPCFYNFLTIRYAFFRDVRTLVQLCWLKFNTTVYTGAPSISPSRWHDIDRNKRAEDNIC